MPARSSSTKGFKQAASLITKRVKEASETRGFAQSRLLTHWEEVAGKDTAKIAQPVKVTYKKKGARRIVGFDLQRCQCTVCGDGKRKYSRAGQFSLWL